MDIRERATIPTASPETPKVQQGSGVARITLLALGDILVFIIFAFIGIRSHKETLTLPGLLVTAAPFAIGWFLVSPFIGVFRRNITSQVSKMSLRTLLAWLVAWPVGLLLRGITRHEIPPLTFAIITLVSNAIFLQIWRVPFAWFAGRKR